MVDNSKEADILIKFLKYRFQRGYSTIILVIGARGTGKSSTCYRLSELINEELNPLREKLNLKKRECGTLVTSHLDNMSFVKNSQMGDDCILEEISVLYPSRRSMSDESVGISKTFDIIRKKRLIIFANCPMALGADKNIRASSNAMLLTLKIIKTKKVVVSKFWKLQTNYMLGKVYFHQFERDGEEVDFMYTKMPNKERWKDYEDDKDSFIDNEYEKLLRKAEIKKEKELQDLGMIDTPRKELTDKQRQVMELLSEHTGKETAKLLGISENVVSRHKKYARKKNYLVEEFKKNDKNK
jgi:DNA-binding CsgD family transcriptional regulator